MTKTNPGLNLYLLFNVSWFLHLGARIPLLGEIRFDLILVCILAALALAARGRQTAPPTATDKLLRVLIIYCLVTLPFVEWPGSVLRTGIPNFIKAIVFYYFTVAFVRNERDLRKFVLVFVACQLWRIFEPLYLHVTRGYWGEFATMGDWEFLDRLSGAPNDVVNPNGLAFIICTVIPFLYFTARLSWLNRLAFWVCTPLCLYTLVLTASRTGFLALLVIFGGILVKSKQRVLVATLGIVVAIVALPLLGGDIQDRYLSIIGMGKKNEATAQGRLQGVEGNFRVAMRRPIFGHGLGASAEANANFGDNDKPAHDLYAEVAEELGLVGLVIVLLFIKSIFSAFRNCARAYAQAAADGFMPRLIDAMGVWLWMNLLFSFASYGLTSYEWYLLGGFSVAMLRLIEHRTSEATKPVALAIGQRA